MIRNSSCFSVWRLTERPFRSASGANARHNSSRKVGLLCGVAIFNSGEIKLSRSTTGNYDVVVRLTRSRIARVSLFFCVSFLQLRDCLRSLKIIYLLFNRAAKIVSCENFSCFLTSVRRFTLKMLSSIISSHEELNWKSSSTSIKKIQIMLLLKFFTDSDVLKFQKKEKTIGLYIRNQTVYLTTKSKSIAYHHTNTHLFARDAHYYLIRPREIHAESMISNSIVALKCNDCTKCYINTI